MKWNNENAREKWLSALINWLNWWRIQFFKPSRKIKARFYSALNEVTSRFAELAMNLSCVPLKRPNLHKDNLSGRGQTWEKFSHREHFNKR